MGIRKQKTGGRRTRIRPGARLLGATALHSEEEPDAGEGGRRRSQVQLGPDPRLKAWVGGEVSMQLEPEEAGVFVVGEGSRRLSRACCHLLAPRLAFLVG
jgi:hypothetical protein